jgi:hypothetical protein
MWGEKVTREMEKKKRGEKVTKEVGEKVTKEKDEEMRRKMKEIPVEMAQSVRLRERSPVQLNLLLNR